MRKFEIGQLVTLTRDGVLQDYKLKIVGYARNGYYVIEHIQKGVTFQASESELDTLGV